MSDAILTDFHRGFSRHGLGSAAAALCLVLLALGFAAAGLAHRTPPLPPPAPARTAPPPRPSWIEIPRPVQIFSLEARALRALPSTYKARRLDIGEGREDVLSFGTLAGEDAALRLRIYRRAGKAAAVPLFSALAREAADADLSITHSSLSDMMPTRFGAFEIADVTLASPTPGSKVVRACSGFRLVRDDPALTMTGLACGAPAHPLTRSALGCLVDRLDLASAGDDEALVTFFARTELERDSSCSGVHLGPDAVHAAWLDDKPATSRKSLRRH